MSTPENHGADQRIRELLERAVADVEPRRGLDEIRVRTTPARRRLVWARVAGGSAAAAAAVAVLAAIGASGALPFDVPGTLSPADRDAANDPPPSSTDQVLTPVYFVGATGQGARLFPEEHVSAGRTPDVATLVADAVAGRTDDPDYSSSWPAGTEVRSVRHDKTDDRVVVDLVGPVVDRPVGLTPAQALLAVQQVAWTVRAATGPGTSVVFRHDGDATSTVLGVPTREPVAAGSADSLMSPISITAPASDDEVFSPFTVRGRAATFEANAQWELKRGGTVVRRGFTTARECCTSSPYSFTVRAPAGTYTLVVHDEDVSGGEGGGGTSPTADTKTVTVLPPEDASTPP